LTKPPTVLVVIVLTMPSTGERMSVRRSRSLALRAVWRITEYSDAALVSSASASCRNCSPAS
jgi:hypothetical protein